MESFTLAFYYWPWHLFLKTVISYLQLYTSSHFSSQQTPMHSSRSNSDMMSSVKASQILQLFLFCACKVLSVNSSKNSCHTGLQLWVNKFVSLHQTSRSSSTVVKFSAGLSPQILAHSSFLNEWMNEWKKSVTEPLSFEPSSAHAFSFQNDSATENKEKMWISRKREGSINKYLCERTRDTKQAPSGMAGCLLYVQVYSTPAGAGLVAHARPAPYLCRW